MAALSIHLKPSSRLVIMLSLAHLVAAGLLWPLALPWSVKVVIIVLLIISLGHYLRQDALRTASNAVIAFELSEAMQCTLTTRSGETMACIILGSTFVTSYLTVLNLRAEGKFFTYSIVILPDSIDTEEFRQLRVWLRWRWRKTDRE